MLGCKGKEGYCLLFIGIDTILLRSNKIKERLRPPIQLVDLPILTLLNRVRLPELVEYGEQERPVVQRAVLDSIIELRHLFKRVSRIIHRRKVTLRLTREGSNFFCSTSQKSSKSFSHRSRNNQGSSPQHLFGYWPNEFLSLLAYPVAIRTIYPESYPRPEFRNCGA